ncbi:hypothetical protein CA13_32660 [Planctomycetes bacterium CA13]|uniref:Uncharacterized protein n=1 Tax=Novipirellula herctigrandis TaxID=2527986 RepID=A0A5C5Z5G6_9BACT|nr:hypothetical protein CA13_32660 [Planctomycetes bacterium CA13]
MELGGRRCLAGFHKEVEVNSSATSNVHSVGVGSQQSAGCLSDFANDNRVRQDRSLDR